jgi:hypothetical protein
VPTTCGIETAATAICVTHLRDEHRRQQAANAKPATEATHSGDTRDDD